MVIANGKLLVDGTPAELEARSPYHHAVYVRTEGRLQNALISEIGTLPGVQRVEPSGRPDDFGVYVLPRDGADVAPAVRGLLAARGIGIVEMRIERGRLDGVFRDITLAA
jgi:ABC-2 type transport system ATP-binding protein